MALEEQILADMKTALLNPEGGDRFNGDILRNLKAAILNEKVANGTRNEAMSDESVEKIVAREVKKRRESIKLYEENGRQELAENEKREIAVLEKYLPKMMDESEVSTLVDDIIKNIDGVSMQKMGQVIGAVKAKAGNTADGALVAKLVKEKLQGI